MASQKRARLSAGHLLFDDRDIQELYNGTLLELFGVNAIHV